jgi:hypothetical protein
MCAASGPSLSGLELLRAELRIIGTTHNLLTLFRHHWRPVSA